MTDNQAGANARLDKARALVEALEAGAKERSEALLQELGEMHENALFEELGRLTRELHEAINGFLLDERIQRIADFEIPDATERLKYVIQVTERAAHTTLEAVERGMPLVGALEADATDLTADWQRFRERRLDLGEFRELAQRLDAFLERTARDGSELHRLLGDVLMAQDYQDITGQIIRRVIELVHDVEQRLVQLVRLTGGRRELERPPEDGIAATGPAIPGTHRANVVQDQDEVDDLLSSLGF